MNEELNRRETLTFDQRAVVERPLESRTIVVAGPGTGKTHTLVARIENLIESESEIAAQEVLSLSFSRAAVAELRRRVAALSTRGSRVRSATFDSFATRLLETTRGSALAELDYDQRIMSATELIQGRGIGDFMTIRHILVDEAQDLTGIRADFVLKLLEVADCGFTIFVDQAQAIYDFASGEFENSPSFVERVEAVYTSGVETRTLSSNFRTTDPQLLTIAGLGELIRNSEAKREDVAEKFRREMQKLPAAGSVDGAAQLLCVANDTAVLTRRNNEALAVSAALYNAGVKHQFRRRADDPVVGSWLSRLSSRIASTRLTRADLEEDESILPWPAQVTWGALSRVSPPRRGAINLEAVADRLALNMPPDELIDTNTGEVVVSSIHRSKGLEFTTVLLIPFEIPEDDWLQEARILYVGLTRAKQNLMALQPVDDRRWSFLQGANRWRRIGFAGKRTYTTGIEVTGSDAFSFDATGVLRPQRDPAELIDYLHTEVHAGDTVTLIRRVTDAVYDVLHEGNWVAVTTPGFGELVNNRLGLKNPPARIDGCRVETLSTVALSTQAAELLGVSTRLVPNCRIQGVGTW